MVTSVSGVNSKQKVGPTFYRFRNVIIPFNTYFDCPPTDKFKWNQKDPTLTPFNRNDYLYICIFRTFLLPTKKIFHLSKADRIFNTSGN